MKLVRFAFLASVMASAVACAASTDSSGSLEESVGVDDVDSGREVAEASFALGVATRVVGDTACPTGYSLATPAEALANQAAVCSKLGTWDIARLSGGGSMDGPGYGCGIRSTDTRSLGHSVCKQAVQFTRGIGDGVCPSGYTVANSMVARANQSSICSTLGTWDIARLAGGGSMDGPGYGCGIRDADSRSLGNTVCVQLDFVRPVGDKPCPAGSALISPQEARARQAELCGKLGTWDIARLDGGGSMDGPGYGCAIRDSDTRTLGNALCGAL
ncbi:hypothetical protein WME98_29205 [Sorangium sp. So ce296]|uniref:hypothetical protein n=1 Tax=Sorangium sp. So ce296 TaxID=3133296 RepID=UPI003F60CAF0